MCGIYGSTIIYNESEIIAKLKRTAFRGPDYSGYKFYNYDKQPFILGHNRLAIIDLDPRSNQPFSYNQLHIVFNGEIYNFPTIKETLIERGHKFYTTSDT